MIFRTGQNSVSPCGTTNTKFSCRGNVYDGFSHASFPQEQLRGERCLTHIFLDFVLTYAHHPCWVKPAMVCTRTGIPSLIVLNRHLAFAIRQPDQGNQVGISSRYSPVHGQEIVRELDAQLASGFPFRYTHNQTSYPLVARLLQHQRPGQCQDSVAWMVTITPQESASSGR